MSHTPDPKSPYPEHERQAAVLADAETIGVFLDTSGYVLAEHIKIEGYALPQLVPVSKSVQQIIADYFDIDLTKIEAEKRAILDALRGKDDAS